MFFVKYQMVQSQLLKIAKCSQFQHYLCNCLLYGIDCLLSILTAAYQQPNLLQMYWLYLLNLFQRLLFQFTIERSKKPASHGCFCSSVLLKTQSSENIQLQPQPDSPTNPPTYDSQLDCYSTLNNSICVEYAQLYNSKTSSLNSWFTQRCIFYRTVLYGHICSRLTYETSSLQTRIEIAIHNRTE
ncbi:Hypothetical_protein [Hexamita inflata]|uniref:Hypothetical_protein n=1 Tax=Hexamita inflata TaxID=28002 RepID=A0AA86N850_9EUKA|nr:Hypothetical protein HINF_LOCUS2409 [Hexamita inflata]